MIEGAIAHQMRCLAEKANRVLARLRNQEPALADEARRTTL